MSGASADATVPSCVSMSPKFFWTTEMVAPFDDAQAFATLVMAGARFASVQMTIVGPALWDAAADDARTAATAVAAPSSAHMRLRFCIEPFFVLWGLLTRASWGQAPPRV